MREDQLVAGVVSRTVDVELSGDLGPRRSAEQVLQRTAGDRLDATVEAVDAIHFETAEEDRAMLQQTHLDHVAVVSDPLDQVDAGESRAAQQRQPLAFEEGREGDALPLAPGDAPACPAHGGQGIGLGVAHGAP
ncbi:hypothetical protein D9M71_547840 [compost metagenome]